ncbi:MAG: type IV secretory system conjugative DNA transfer family protein [Desulfotalea sp.]
MNNINVSQKGTARFALDMDTGTVNESNLSGKHCFIGNHENQDQHLMVEVDSHLLTIGGSRSGKTVGQVIPNLLWAKGSSFVIDPKGEIAWNTAEYLRGIGKKVLILDPFQEVNRHYGKKVSVVECIARYNPLSEINATDLDYAGKITYITTSLILVEGKDPHWGNSAQELIAGLIAYVVETPSEEKSLGRVKELLSGDVPGIIAIAKIIVENKGDYPQNSLARMKLSRYAGLNPNNGNTEKYSIVSTCLSQLRFLDTPEIRDSLSSSDFSFTELVRSSVDTVVFLVLPPTKLESYNRWLRLMISMAIEGVTSVGCSMERPVTFYLDEFGTIGKLPAIAQAVGLMAGRGIRLWFFIQSLSNLKCDYPSEWSKFIGNSSAISVLKVGDDETAQYISNLLGDKTVSESMGSHNTTSTYPLLAPDQLRRMLPHNGLLITDTHPVIFRKAKCYEDMPFRDAIRPDPDYSSQHKFC